MIRWIYIHICVCVLCVHVRARVHVSPFYHNRIISYFSYWVCFPGKLWLKHIPLFFFIFILSLQFK